jgi:hypothetical protein
MRIECVDGVGLPTQKFLIAGTGGHFGQLCKCGGAIFKDWPVLEES